MDVDTYQETLDRQEPRPRPLFSDRAVLWATFLGSPLAGGTLMSMNFHRMGRPEVMAKTLLMSLAFTVELRLCCEPFRVEHVLVFDCWNDSRSESSSPAVAAETMK